jgi:hypothetical protein
MREIPGVKSTVAQQNIETQLLFSSNLRPDFNLNLRNLAIRRPPPIPLRSPHDTPRALRPSHPLPATRFTIILLEGRSGHFRPQKLFKRYDYRLCDPSPGVLA